MTPRSQDCQPLVPCRWPPSRRSWVTPRQTPPGTRPRLQLRVDAVNAWVRCLPVASDALTYGPPPRPGPIRHHGAVMLATRLWRRKDSPSGVETFTDQGAIYVSRNDPDVARLLKLGTFAGPGVG
jgi:hypothetical protein